MSPNYWRIALVLAVLGSGCRSQSHGELAIAPDTPIADPTADAGQRTALPPFGNWTRDMDEGGMVNLTLAPNQLRAVFHWKNGQTLTIEAKCRLSGDDVVSGELTRFEMSGNNLEINAEVGQPFEMAVRRERDDLVIAGFQTRADILHGAEAIQGRYRNARPGEEDRRESPLVIEIGPGPVEPVITGRPGENLRVECRSPEGFHTSYEEHGDDYRIGVGIGPFKLK